MSEIRELNTRVQHLENILRYAPTMMPVQVLAADLTAQSGCRYMYSVDTMPGTTYKNEDRTGQKKDTTGQNEDFTGQSEDITGQNEDFTDQAAVKLPGTVQQRQDQGDEQAQAACEVDKETVARNGSTKQWIRTQGVWRIQAAKAESYTASKKVLCARSRL